MHEYIQLHEYSQRIAIQLNCKGVACNTLLHLGKPVELSERRLWKISQPLISHEGVPTFRKCDIFILQITTQ